MTELHTIINKQDLINLANEMKMNAVQNKMEEKPIYAPTKTKAYEKVLNCSPNIIEKCLTVSNLIIYEEKIYSLVLTVDLFEGEEKWHLSITHFDPSKGMIPYWPEDIVIDFINSCFFIEYQETGQEGSFENIRHFKCLKGPPKK